MFCCIAGISEPEIERQKVLLTVKLNILEAQAYQMAGRVFSLTSPVDVATVSACFKLTLLVDILLDFPFNINLIDHIYHHHHHVLYQVMSLQTTNVALYKCSCFHILKFVHDIILGCGVSFLWPPHPHYS